MNCKRPKCAGRLRITHTYTEHTAKYQRAVCEVCKTVHTLQTIAEPTVARGQGAKALARRASLTKP